MRTPRGRIVAVAVVLVLGVAACGDDDDNGEAGGEGNGGGTVITATDFAFDPAELTVGPGETITLRNDGEAEHSFTIDDPEIEAEAHGGEEADAEAPDEAGTYDFYCEYHPDQMTGTLTVE